MKNIIILLILIFLNLQAQNSNSIDCTTLFEARKSELIKELEKIDEAKQALEAYKASLNSLNEQKKSLLDKQEADINATMTKVENTKKEIQVIVQKNEEILKELKNMTTDKVSEAYSKMKDQAAADVLTQMGAIKAATIMYALPPKKISTVMAKMDPKIASEITLILQKGPPFENNKTILYNEK
ncbi:MotE family protein [Campylobacter sp. RM12327]|uniref:MotE family protein n=1 Tax=Campylobacter sputorum TaxID=206 RepID=UPI000B799282|nr:MULTISPECIES: MotE family protein [Campylobacter]ASM39389.1 putative motility protein chaperone MotE [Campylobacter sputorum]MBE7358277.1 MotE family protein [Campylobacter sp. RM11302]MBF6669569.1 MotE family protein [Campylobacter sp. RM12327]MBF6674278.1 MotE family protein [Campylobacter sp. RM13538]MBF6676062.1 MotE family protein [Campylobacter sp. RM12321]